MVLGVLIAVGSFFIALFAMLFGNGGSTPRSNSIGPETDPFAEGTDLHSEYFDR
jgi:hypothetical protein